MAQDLRVVPKGVPDSPPYADAYLVQSIGGVVTVFLMRLPHVFTEAQSRTVVESTEVHAPVVSCFTIPTSMAKGLADAIQSFAKAQE